jgi:hypothetical protein
MFSKEERAGFKYTFAHWCAFQMTALNMGVWKIKYLFHDIEKPWLKLFLRDYSKVQKWHRTHNNHHLEYSGGVDKIDCEALIIDWECSHLTKIKSRNRCREEVYNKINNGHPQSDFLKEKIIPLLDKYNL